MIVTHLSAYEVKLLASLIKQLIELKSRCTSSRPHATPPEPTTPRWSRTLRAIQMSQSNQKTRCWMGCSPRHTLMTTRLLQISASFTERDLKATNVAEARAVLDRLATELSPSRSRDPREEVESWLRTLTSVRLAVATRLGIHDAAAADEPAALPDEDPRSFMVSVYDWLGFAQETPFRALTRFWKAVTTWQGTH